MAEETSDIIYWFWRLIPVVILILFMVGILYNFLSTEINIMDEEVLILSKTLLSNCLAYKDEARTYPNIIDKNKLSREHLLNCAKKDDFGYILKLKTKNGEFTEVSAFDAEQKMYYNVCQTVPEFKCQKREFFVLVNDGEKTDEATLELGVIKRV